MEPQWLPPNTKYPFGIGHSGSFGDMDVFGDVLKDFVANMWAQNSLPVTSVLSHSVGIPKNMIPNMSFEQAVVCERPIHVFNTFTQAILKTCKARRSFPTPAYNSFDAIRNRRREEAIAVQCTIMHKCRENDVSYIQQCFDTTNAFHCIKHVYLGECQEYMHDH